MNPNSNATLQAGPNFDHAAFDPLIASSQDALALAIELRARGQNELANRWARFAEFLNASETYVGPPRPSSLPRA